MFGLLDDAVDIASDAVGSVVEIVTLGLIEQKEAKRLAKLGYEISEIASTMGVTPEQVKDALK